MLKEQIGQATGVAPEIDRVGNTEGTVHFNKVSSSVERVEAEWKTGAFTKVDTAGTGTFIFNGATIEITYGAGTTGATANPTGTSIELQINTTATAGDQRDAIFDALEKMQKISGSPLEKYKFAKDGADSISIETNNKATSPETLNTFTIKTTGDTKIANPEDKQLTTPGVDEKKAEYEFDITNVFRENETIKIGSETFTGVQTGADPFQQTFDVSVNGTARDQASSLQKAIKASSLANRYDVTISETTIKLVEKNAGDERKAGEPVLTAPETDLVNAIKGEFKFNMERAIIGQSYTIDGIEIAVVNDSTQFNADINNGSAIRHTDVLSDQARNLRDAIARNPELNKKYSVSGDGTEVILTQRDNHESSSLPQIMLSNAGDGDVFKSNLQIGPNQHQVMTVRTE